MDIYSITFLVLIAIFVIHCIMTRGPDGLLWHLKSRPVMAAAVIYYLIVMFMIEIMKSSMSESLYEIFGNINFVCSIVIFYYLAEYAIKFAFNTNKKD